MPQWSPQQFTDTLRRLRPPTTDPYVTRRTDEIYSGLDDMIPEAGSADIRQLQDESGGRYSRDSIRSGAMGNLRQLLKRGQIEHGQVMEREGQRGQFQLEGQDRAAKIAADRFDATTEASDRRTAASQEGQDRRLALQIAAASGRQKDAQDFKVNNPTATQAAVPGQMYDAINKAEAARSGWAQPLKRLIWGKTSEDNQYEQTLANYLDRKGELEDAQAVLSRLGRYQGSLDERIAASQADPNFEYDLSTLDPYTRKYLALKLGQ